MKNIFLVLPVILAFSTFGQGKYNSTNVGKLTEVKGTEFVITSVENNGKSLINRSKYLLFINTKTGDTNRVDFPKDASIRKIEQIKIDSLNINLIVVSAKTVDLDGKNGISWNDPMQLIVLTPDGKQKTQITNDNFFLQTWTVNTMTGRMVIAGYYDTNNNKKYDKDDKNGILVYDLSKMKSLYKM